MWGLAAVVLLAAAPGERMPLTMGSSWNTCPFNIALLSLPALVLLLAAMRSLAPTRLRWAGAATGLLAGALGTLVYVLHCPELEAPFLAVWYVLGMLIPVAVGALVGPRVAALVAATQAVERFAARARRRMQIPQPTVGPLRPRPNER